MKNYIYIIAACIFLNAFCACKKEGLKTYGTTNSVYFALAKEGPLNNPLFVTDTLDLPLGFVPLAVKDTIAKIIVCATGAPQQVDRSYRMIADTGSTAISGLHYDVLPGHYTMRAGNVRDTILFKLHRTPDMAQKQFTLYLLLAPGGDFNTDFTVNKYSSTKSASMVRYRITISDIQGEPVRWKYYAQYFGVYSKKKFDLLISLTGNDPNVYNQGILVTVPAFDFVKNVSYAANVLKRYVDDQKLAGNTVYEDNGMEMIVPGAIQ